MIRRRTPQSRKGWLEEWLDFSFPEKLISIMWFGMPYIIWMMADGLDIWIRTLVSVGVFIFLSLLCYWFGMFMSSGDRDWN
jgi:hypothetical protein